MFVGKVVGTVWSTVKWPAVTGHKLLLVRPYHLADLLAHPSAAEASPNPAAASVAPSAIPPPMANHLDSEAVVCIDLLDAGVGDDVIVAFGHAARVAAESVSPTAAPITPIDAAVVAVVDGFHIVRPGT